MKRILAILVSVVMLLSMVVAPASASTTPTVTVQTVEGVAKAGDTVTLEVSIANNPGFTNFEWTINYDTDKLELQSINTSRELELPGVGKFTVPYISDALVEANVSSELAGGKPFITCAKTTPFADNVTLFTLTFVAKNAAVEGTAAVAIESGKFENGAIADKAINATYVAGGITVAHTCGNVTFVQGQTASCTVPGWNGYYKCTCGVLYADKACQVVIKDLEAWKTGDGKTTADHTYGEWKTDAEKHWKECTCNFKAFEGVHEYDGDADTTCNVCNYTRTIEDDTTGGSTTGGSTTGGSTTGGSTTGGSTTGGSTTGGSTTGVTISGVPTTVTYGDAAFNLTASAANAGSNAVWTWTSSNSNVLTVSSTGKVTVVGAGKATITVKYESDSTIGMASVEITVNKAEQSIRGRHIVLYAGESINLSEIYSAEGTLSYRMLLGGRISNNILYAGSVAGIYALEVTAAETANYKAVTRGYDVMIMAKQDVVAPVYPITPVPAYTLSFETNGGTAIPSVKKITFSVVTLSDYVTIKEGYVFAGWYADKALTKSITTVRIIRDTTVYAKWVSAECDGGSNCPSHVFTDVDHSLWYHKGIDFVVKNGLMLGMGNNKFDPHGTTSRAMILTILYRLEGEPTISGKNPFVDVKNGTWYTDAVIWAEENGIVDGYGEGKFGPDDAITREQMAKILYNYAKYKKYNVSARTSLSPFSDSNKINSWATDEMQWAVAVGLIQGMSDEIINPQGNAERCQVAVIFMRFCNEYVK